MSVDFHLPVHESLVPLHDDDHGGVAQGHAGKKLKKPFQLSSRKFGSSMHF